MLGGGRREPGAAAVGVGAYDIGCLRGPDRASDALRNSALSDRPDSNLRGFDV